MNESFNSEEHKSVLFGQGAYIKAALVLLVVFLAVLSVKGLKEIGVVGEGITPANTIVVNGEGEAVYTPDLATFTMTVNEEASSVSSAQDAATKKINDVMAFLTASGIDKKDIKTVGYNIYPRYEYRDARITYPYSQGTRFLAGYNVSQTLGVKIRKLEDVGKIFSGVTGKGVTDLGELNFTIEDRDEQLAKARKEAIEDAKAKAKSLAKDLGVRLVKIVSYSDSGDYPPGPYARMTLESSAKDAGVPDVPAGEGKIVSNVAITYEIR